MPADFVGKLRGFRCFFSTLVTIRRALRYSRLARMHMQRLVNVRRAVAITKSCLSISIDDFVPRLQGPARFKAAIPGA